MVCISVLRYLSYQQFCKISNKYPNSFFSTYKSFEWDLILSLCCNIFQQKMTEIGPDHHLQSLVKEMFKTLPTVRVVRGR